MRAFFIAFLLLPSLLFAQSTSWNAEQENRLQHLLGQLKCVVCQGQSLRQSDATLAQDIRLLVKQEIQNQQTDQQILDQLAQRYGTQILFTPPLQPSTYALWALPALLLFFALGMFYRQQRRTRQESA